MELEHAIKALKLADYAEAAKLFRDAADNGNPDACDFMVQLNLMKLCDDVTDKDALEYAIKGYELKSKDSCRNLGLMYLNGFMGEPDYGKAREFFLEGWESVSDLECAYRLGEMARLGLGGKSDADAAVKYYVEAASKNHYPSQFALAVMFERTVKDFSATLDFYRSSVDAGHADAALRLAKIHEKGIRVEKNAEEACYWYAKAAEMGSEEAAIMQAGLAVREGAEAAASDAEASLRRILEQGSDAGRRDAAFLLGRLLESGKLGDNRDAEAVVMYSDASKLGSLPGLFKYAVSLAEGYGTDENRSLAYSLLHVARFMALSNTEPARAAASIFMDAEHIVEASEKHLVDLEEVMTSGEMDRAKADADVMIGRVFGVSAGASGPIATA